MYLLLFRVEVSDAGNSVSNIGGDTIATGAVAGFSMPTLRYYVSNSSNTDIQQIAGINTEVDDLVTQTRPIVLSWKKIADAKLYRLEILDEDKTVFTAMILPSSNEYQLPSFLRELVAAKPMKWRVTAVDDAGKVIDQSKPLDITLP